MYRKVSFGTAPGGPVSECGLSYEVYLWRDSTV